ncbi:hypothetical protein B9Z55_016483 [Caenorhabditis nigoni]|nr:hypothetical protein B9Z55_016483 [Caenorhabditis nigoni]
MGQTIPEIFQLYDPPFALLCGTILAVMKHLNNVPKESDWFKICYDTLTSAGFPSFSTAIASVIWYFNSKTSGIRPAMLLMSTILVALDTWYASIDYGTEDPKPYFHDYTENLGSFALGVVMVDVMYSRGADIPNLDLTISTTLIASIFIIFRYVLTHPAFDIINHINGLMIVCSLIVLIVSFVDWKNRSN